MSWYSDEDKLKCLIGHKITEVHMGQDLLKFVGVAGTETKEFYFTVDGDCCSHSYFYDFYGADKLVRNGPVISVKELDLPYGEQDSDAKGNPSDANGKTGDVIKVYGFEIVTENDYWGDQTAVFSFRNDSNGYYGGSLVKADSLETLERNQWTKEFVGNLVDISYREWYVAND